MKTRLPAAKMLGLVSLALLSGCATIMSGTTQRVSFNSNPEGALVTVNGRAIGKTPVSVQLDKRAGQSVSIEKDGYQPLTLTPYTRINGWFWGNIVIGGFFGSTTDGVTGAVYEYSQGQYFATLQPIGSSRVEPDQGRSQADNIKVFVIANYRDLRKDLAAGKGEHLDSLLTMLNIHDANRSEATSLLKDLSETYSDIPAFAERVANLYSK